MKIQLSSLLVLSGLALGGLCQGAVSAPDGPEAVIAVVAADGVQHVRIAGGGYFFKPNHVTVKVNVPVELTVSVESGITPHSFVIQAPEAGIQLKESLSSDPKTLRFTPTATGQFPFYCDKGLPFMKSHRQRGMEGVLEVVP